MLSSTCRTTAGPWPDDFDYLDMADQVAAALPDEPVTLVGHSMGVMDRSIEAAASHQECARRIWRSATSTE